MQMLKYLALVILVPLSSPIHHTPQLVLAMPRAQKDAGDGDRDLNTCVLRNRRIGPLQNRFGPARGVMLFQPPVGVVCFPVLSTHFFLLTQSYSDPTKRPAVVTVMTNRRTWYAFVIHHGI